MYITTQDSTYSSLFRFFCLAEELKNNPIFEKNRMSMTARATNINPRGYQFGFIYNELSNTKTIAHELCHGAYHLRHTFDEADYLAPEGTTDNLMDYNGGTELNHLQWQWSHETHRNVLGFLDEEEESEFTTDGHYYLFTYLGMLMGMSYDEAEKYGKWAEEPDSKVTNAGDMEENITWLIGNLQQRNHALTGGEHGVELAATVYAITHYLTEENKLYLFHRFGDCYAHLNNSNDSKGFDNNVALKSYIDAFDKYIKDNFSFVGENSQNLMADGKIITIRPNEIIYDKKYITSIPRDKFIQMILRKILTADSEGGLESESKSAFRFKYTNYSGFDSYWQKIYGEYEYTYSDIVSDLKKYLPQARQNSYKMYGSDQEGMIDSWCTFTVGHGYENFKIPKTGIVIGSNPDAIVRRKELFSLYTRHLYQLFTMLGKNNGANENDICNKIDSIIKWASDKDLKDARFDGIFAFEIMCLNEKINPKNAHGKQVLIPVKYLPEEVKKSDGFADIYYEKIANFEEDAILQENLLEEYIEDTYNLEIGKIEKSKDGKSIIVYNYIQIRSAKITEEIR